jgi:hypothetical protein
VVGPDAHPLGVLSLTVTGEAASGPLLESVIV